MTICNDWIENEPAKSSWEDPVLGRIWVEEHRVKRLNGYDEWPIGTVFGSKGKLCEFILTLPSQQIVIQC